MATAVGELERTSQTIGVSAVLDCAGVDNGTAVIDCDSTCCGGNTTIACANTTSCDGLFCCGGDSGIVCPTVDCNTACCGGDTNVTCFVLSNCGICQSVIEPITAGEDCNGDCFGSAILDDCAECCEVYYFFLFYIEFMN